MLTFIRRLALLCALSCLGMPVRGDEPTLEQLRANYLQSLAMLDSLHVKQSGVRTWLRPLFGEGSRFANDPRFTMEPSYFREEWAISGDRAFFRSEVSKDGENFRELEACWSDGNFDWVTLYERASKKPLCLWKRKADPRYVVGYRDGQHQSNLESQIFFVALGTWFSYGGHSFASMKISDVLASSRATVERAQIGQHDVWAVSLRDIKSSTDKWNVDVSVWLDPNAGGLPRQIEIGRSGEVDGTIRVEEFGHRGTAAGTVWYPVKWSRTTAVSKQEFTISSIEVNEPLDGGLFRPGSDLEIPVRDWGDRQDIDQRESVMETLQRARMQAIRREFLEREARRNGSSDRRVAPGAE